MKSSLYVAFNNITTVYYPNVMLVVTKNAIAKLGSACKTSAQ